MKKFRNITKDYPIYEECWKRTSCFIMSHQSWTNPRTNVSLYKCTHFTGAVGLVYTARSSNRSILATKLTQLAHAHTFRICWHCTHISGALPHCERWERASHATPFASFVTTYTFLTLIRSFRNSHQVSHFYVTAVPPFLSLVIYRNRSLDSIIVLPDIINKPTGLNSWQKSSTFFPIDHRPLPSCSLVQYMWWTGGQREIICNVLIN